MARNRHAPFLRQVLVLTMASFLTRQPPTITLDHSNGVTNLHGWLSVDIELAAGGRPMCRWPIVSGAAFRRLDESIARFSTLDKR